MFFKRRLDTSFRSCNSITADLNDILSESRVQEGLCIVSVPHTTAGLAITSFWDPRGLADLLDEIDRNIPTRVSYKHQDSPYAASGHVKSALMGSSVMLIIHNGKFVLGSSQGLVFVEFDGPRPREFWVEIIDKPFYIEKSNIQTEYMGMHDVSLTVKDIIAKSGVQNGICHIAMLHSTAGLLLAAKQKELAEDVMANIERMVPTRVDFKHRETASDAGGHVKTALTGSQLSLPVKNGKLIIGENKVITFAEYDGPRPRSFYVAVYED